MIYKALGFLRQAPNQTEAHRVGWRLQIWPVEDVKYVQKKFLRSHENSYARDTKDMRHKGSAVLISIPCALAYFSCHLTAIRIKDYLQAPSFFVLGWREFFSTIFSHQCKFYPLSAADFRHAHNLSPTVCLSARTADQKIFSPRKIYLYLTKSFTVKIWFINEFSRITTVKDLEK